MKGGALLAIGLLVAVIVCVTAQQGRDTGQGQVKGQGRVKGSTPKIWLQQEGELIVRRGPGNQIIESSWPHPPLQNKLSSNPADAPSIEVAIGWIIIQTGRVHSKLKFAELHNKTSHQ